MLHPDAAGGNALAVLSINSVNPGDSEGTDCLTIKGQSYIKPGLNNRYHLGVKMYVNISIISFHKWKEERQ